MNTNRLKEKLQKGKTAVGTFVRMDSISVEILGRTGWDFVIIDVEHGVHTMEDVSNMIRAARAAGITSIVRVPGTAPIHIQRSLDAGADGVQIPQLTSIVEADAAIKAARYYPYGNRGACAYSAATGYSTIPFPEHIETSNSEAMVVVHVENAWMADHIEALLELNGIDVVFCGPWDMSQSLGIPGQTKDPLVTDRIDKVLMACREKGVPSGIFVQKPEDADPWLEKGVTYLTCSVDVGIFADAARVIADDLKARVRERER